MQNFLVFVLAVRFRLKKAYVADGITRGTMSRQVKLVQSQRKDQNQKNWNIQGQKSIVSLKFLIFSGKKFPIFFGKNFRWFFGKNFRFQINIILEFFPKQGFLFFFAKKVPIFIRKKFHDFYLKKSFRSFFFFSGKNFNFFRKKVPDFFAEKSFDIT